MVDQADRRGPCLGRGGCIRPFAHGDRALDRGCPALFVERGQRRPEGPPKQGALPLRAVQKSHRRLDQSERLESFQVGPRSHAGTLARCLSLDRRAENSELSPVQ